MIALIFLLLSLCLGGPTSSLVASGAKAEDSSPLTASINWDIVGKSVQPQAYGQNSNGFIHDSYTADPGFMSHIRYLNGNQGLIRIHSTGMINTSGWLNEDLTWNETKIVNALAPLVDEQYPIMINIPYGPNGKEDYLDADAFASFAAELVEIVNIEHELGIQYWEIPNERESGFITPGLNASAMANLIKKSYMAMKSIDPTIKVGGPATADVKVSYLTSVVDQALPYIDFVTMHAYSSGQSSPKTDAAAYDHAQNQGTLVDSLRTGLLAIGPSADLPIFIDEYNMTWDTDPRLHTSKESVYAALLVANVIGGAGTAVNFWHAESSYMGLMNDGRELYDTADLYYWLNRFFHGQVVTSVFSDETKVDGYAVKSAERKSILLANRTDAEQTIELQHLGAAPSSYWDMYRIDAAGSSQLANVNGAAWSTAGITLPAHSVTIITQGVDVTLFEHIPYTIMNMDSGTLLTLEDATSDVIHEQDQLNDHQQWILQKTGTNQYEIRSKVDQSLLKISYGAGLIADKWELLSIGGEGYQLQAVGTTMVLAISGDPLDEFALVEANTLADRQKWTFRYAGKRTAIIDHAEHLYTITNKASGKVLQIGNSRMTEGGTANLQTNEGLASQKWSFRCYDECSGFRIANANSGLVIHATAAARVTQAPFWYDPPRQLWTLERQTDGSYLIRNNLTSQVLQPSGGSLLEGIFATTGVDAGADYQRWYIAKTTNNHVLPTVEQDVDYILRNLSTGKVISVAGASTANGASVIQETYSGNPEQRWRFSWYVNGTRVINQNSLNVLAPNASGLSIQQTFAFHDSNQQWILERQPDGTYLLVYAANRKVLQPVGGGTADDVRLEWVNPTGATIEKWELIRA